MVETNHHTEKTDGSSWLNVKLASKNCHVLISGASGPTFIWLFHPFEGSELNRMEDILKGENGKNGYRIIACEIEDWDSELSPWEGRAMDGSMMSGGGQKLLLWIEDELIKQLETDCFQSEKIYTMGYSLAGLFALWSLYESDAFDGCVCCSGSLWFDGWDMYSRTHLLKKHSNVYLSLGGKEEKTSNPTVAVIGKRTKEQERLLKTDPLADNVFYEMNPGGHFADSVKRLAKGIKWIMDK